VFVIPFNPFQYPDFINFITHPPGGSRAEKERQIEGNGTQTLILEWG
jgi:hypothetical protein